MEVSIPLPRLAAEIQKLPNGPPFVEVVIDGHRIEDLARIGSRFWFEYHCWESHESGDAEVWYRSHQQCTVLGFCDPDSGADAAPCAYETFEERADAGEVLTYRVRFDDGLEWTVFEDELLTSKDDFCRDDPPPKPKEKVA